MAGGRVRVAAVSVAFTVHALKEARREGGGRKEGRKKTKTKRRRRGRSNCRKRKKDSVSSR
jgi:hypothetical protein